MDTTKIDIPSAVPACSRCRSQKLKCSREQPACERCVRLKAECSYPAPPDRKKLATLRQRRKHGFPNNPGVPQTINERALRDNDFTPSSSDQNTHELRVSSTRTSSHARQYHESPYHESPSSSPGSAQPPRVESLQGLDTQQTARTSQEVSLFLIEIYFQRHYQSDLLFDRDKLIAGFLSGQATPYVILAMFALASIFLDSSGKSIPEEITISDIARTNWITVGEQWARAASQAALVNADQPCLDRVQGCQILAYYWFSKSETSRTNMHTAIAHRTCCLLKVDSLKIANPEEYSALEDLKLRCHWACWLTKCVSQQNAHFRGGCWQDVAGLPLPQHDEHLQEKARQQSLCVDQDGRLQDMQGVKENIKLGYWASMVLLYGLWWEIQDFIYNARRSNLDPATWICKTYNLDQKLQDFYEVLRNDPRYLAYPPISADPTGGVKNFCLTYLYHLCICTLHSFIVPVLSGTHQQLRFSTKMTRLSAEQALKHSTILTDMTAHLLFSVKPDPSKIWPIVGYGTSVCLAIQLRCFLALRILNVERLERARLHLRLANSLKDYWIPLRNICATMERDISHAMTLATYTRPASQDGISNIDYLIAQSLPHESPESTHDIYTYIADDDASREGRKRAHVPQSSTTPLAPVSDTHVSSQMTSRVADPSDPSFHFESNLDLGTERFSHIERSDFMSGPIWWDQPLMDFTSLPGNFFLEPFDS